MSGREEIISILKSKSVLKQDIFCVTKVAFELLKKVLKEEIDLLKKEIGDDDKIRLNYKDKGQSEIQLFIGSDVVIFHQHTNVFKFDETNSVWKTSYLKNDPNLGFCGIINVYNFLADSYLYNRMNDLGYLIGRIFINKENHFIVEGKGQLGFLYRDFMHSQFLEDQVREIVQKVIAYSLNFDLFTPPYDKINEVSVYELQQISSSSKLKTGKRLGFAFENRMKEIK